MGWVDSLAVASRVDVVYSEGMFTVVRVTSARSECAIDRRELLSAGAWVVAAAAEGGARGANCPGNP
jgi:hypothetical protein